MGRKCSHCGNIGHNSRTCTNYKGITATATAFIGNGGVRLFGVQLDLLASSSSCFSMKKSFSMDCLSSSSSSLCSPLVSTDNNNNPDGTCTGYLSDGLVGRVQERKKGIPWTEEEHRRFLTGLEKLGKGDWRGISRNFVTTRTPTQVASHAQKYFLRLSSLSNSHSNSNNKRRSSLFDMVSSRTSHQVVDHHHSSCNKLIITHDHNHELYLNPLPLINTTTTTSTSNSTSTSTPTSTSTACNLQQVVNNNNNHQLSSSSSSSFPNLPPSTPDHLQLTLATPNSLEPSTNSFLVSIRAT